MKPKLLILLFSFLGLSLLSESFESKECYKVNGKILLIYYHVDNKINVIKDYKDENKRFRYMSVLPCPGPLFINNRLVIEGKFDVVDSTKTIFYDDCSVSDILMPFKYNNLLLDSVINDSIVGFLLNNKKHILEPGKIFIDSLVSIVKEGERVIQHTTIFQLENYGLIDRRNIINYNELLINEERARDSIEMEEIKRLYNEK
jgi:hypothetical protein